MKGKLKYIIIITLVLLLGVFGVTYAFYEFYNVGDNHELIVGNLYLKLNDGTDTINLTNVFPETKEEARARTDNQITFTVTGLNTTNDNDIYYDIMLNEGDSIDGKTRAKAEDLVFDLIEIDENGKETTIIDAQSFADINARKVWINTISHDVTSQITRTYKLRVWLSEDTIISDSNAYADYSTSVFANSYASVKVSVYGDFMDRFNLVKVIEQTMPLTNAEDDIDGTRYVYGDVDNNYLWYSGKLWRIVSINEDGSIKLVTQGNMTTIAWNIDSTNNVYENSQIHNWLKNEFLPTLETSVLADSTWDYTTYGTAIATKAEPTAYVENEKVGLLTIYDFTKTGGTESFRTTNTFLNNGYLWWTMSPQTDASRVWVVNADGLASYDAPTGVDGARPSVNLKSNIQIMGGEGTKSNPYVISGDKATGTNSELLSNRISGEYINFNNTLYRIVGVEEVGGKQLTKITMADYNVNKNTLTTSLAFASLVYSPTIGVGLYLEKWYQADSMSESYATTYIKNKYKVMIATANDDKIVWYTGPTAGTVFDYTKSKTGDQVSATIGLGYYGEMFSSQFGAGDNSSTGIRLMTIYSNSRGWFVSYIGSGGYYDPTYYSYGIRPSFYLKADVKIKSGNGQPSSPYKIYQ